MIAKKTIFAFVISCWMLASLTAVTNGAWADVPDDELEAHEEEFMEYEDEDEDYVYEDVDDFDEWDDEDEEEGEVEVEVEDLTHEEWPIFGRAAEFRDQLLSGQVGVYSTEEEPYFLVPQEAKEYELAPLVLRETQQFADPYARMLSVAPSLTREIHRFAEESGILDIIQSLTYGDEQIERTPDSEQTYITKFHRLKQGQEWITMVPMGDYGNWPLCDLNWLDPGSEASHEYNLGVLKRAGFDAILEALGKEFGARSLAVTGMAFMSITNCRDSNPHRDNPGARHVFFQLLLPIVLPERDIATLNIGPSHTETKPIQFRHNTGIFISGDTFHATPDFDFRPNQGLRVVASIYVADVGEEWAQKKVAGDGTALFPPKGMYEWVAAQEGRHWNAQGTVSMKNDHGRAPLRDLVQDQYPEECLMLARQGKCETDLMETRMECLASCKVLINDELYYSEYFPKQAEHKDCPAMMTESTNTSSSLSNGSLLNGTNDCPQDPSVSQGIQKTDEYSAIPETTSSEV